MRNSQCDIPMVWYRHDIGCIEGKDVDIKSLLQVGQEVLSTAVELTAGGTRPGLPRGSPIDKIAATVEATWDSGKCLTSDLQAAVSAWMCTGCRCVQKHSEHASAIISLSWGDSTLEAVFVFEPGIKPVCSVSDKSITLEFRTAV